MRDTFNREINYLRISVTDLCNMRCVYCMPEEGVKLIPHNEILSFEEIIDFVKIAVANGIDKIRLTGGEPLVKRDIISLVAMLGKIKGIKDFAMTSNGSLLEKYAQPLKDAGLHRINISLDTLDENTFSELTRGANLNDVLNGIKKALKVGLYPVKLNCVIHESPDEKDAEEVTKFAEKYGCKIRYIRRMNIEDGKFWPVLGGDGGHCKICNRLRLSSSGILYPCLFSDKSYSIRELGYENALRQAINEKPESGHKSKNKFYNLGG